MALLLMESFDHYATADLTEKWTSIYASGGTVAPAVTASIGRRSTAGVRWSNTVNERAKALGAVVAASGTTCVVGFAFTSSTFASLAGGVANDLTADSGGYSNALCTIRLSGTTHVWFRLNTDGTITALGPPLSFTDWTVKGSSTAALTVGTTAYLEFLVTIHDTTGVITVRKNGIPILSLTSQDTNNGGTPGWNEVVIGRLVTTGAGSAVWDVDDLYIADGSGSAPWNGCLGDVRVDVRNATGAGALADWTPSTGSNWQNIDDAAPDDDSTYNSAATASLTDTFVVDDAPVAGATIYGVQVSLSAKKMDSGTCSLASVVRQSGSNQVGADQNPGTSYAYLRTVYQTNPHTSAQWTDSDFNADEFGYQRTA